MAFDVIIPFVLVLTPGALVYYFYHHIEPGLHEQESEFRHAFESLLYGWPILLANWVVIRWIYQIKGDLSAVSVLFMNAGFYVWYGILSVVFAFALAITLVKTLPWRTRLLFVVSRRLGRPTVSFLSPWGGMFHSADLQAVEVLIPNGKSYSGFVKHVSLQSSEPKELILHESDILRDNPKCFQKVKRVYANCTSGIVIREFDLSSYLELTSQGRASDV